MYLKRLELQGFKTFAERTELEFTPGITAIVGPNGSGKSNVFDAIRWSLGEMSAKSLRGGRMDDVIFAGSERRKGLGMGEVSLTINNDSGLLPVDYAEVAVTRRVTRGGEGEYFLNTLPCRLRDIQMLFLGTGLGGRSYSLIGQGQVDSVLNAGPEDRRALLEEAAGLARYKRRRREAERRLTAAGQNLQRVADVLAELTAQLETLREQAEAAMQYQSYTKEIRDLELALQVDEARRIQSSLKRIVTQAESVQEQLHALAASGAEVGGQIDRDRVRAADVARQWEDAQRALLQITEDMTSRESAMQVLAERVRGTAAQRDRLLGEADRLQARIAEADKMLVELRAQAQALETQRDDLLGGIRSAEQGDQSAAEAQRSTEEQLSVIRAELADLTSARSRAAHDLARMEERAAGFEATIQRLSAKQQELLAQADRLSTITGQLQGAIAELLAERDSVSVRLDGLQRSRGEVEERLGRCEDEMRQRSADRQVVAQTLEFLEDMQGRLAGYEQGVKEILLAKQEHPERFSGIRYPVLELLHVAAPHRAAIEAALGRRLFSLVAGTMEDVKGGLRYLRGNGQGPASFIPVDMLRPNPPVTVPVGPPIVGRATELVQLTNGAKDVVEALLGDVVVVNSLDDAVALKSSGFTGRIATLDGELLTPDGVITFRGKPEGEAQLLGRQEQLETLRARLGEADAAMTRVGGQRIALVDQLAALDAELTAAQVDAARIDGAFAEQQAGLAPIQVESARLPIESAETEAALLQTQTELDRVRKGMARLQADDGELGQAILERESTAAGIEAQLRSAADDAQAAAKQLNQLRVQFAEIAGRLDTLRLRVQEHEHKLSELAAHRDQVQGEVTVLDGEHHLLTHSLEEAQRARTALVEQQEATRTVLTALEEERGALQQRLVGHEATWREIQESLRAIEEQAHRLEVRHAQVDTELSASTRRISEEFGLSWDQVSEIRLPTARDEAVGRIEALRGLVAALGPVNLRAVEEHTAVAGRLHALRTHATDLERARAALVALIQRLDEILRVRFAETFEVVNVEFNRLFVRLFAGGRAQLLLVPIEGTEPGIEIEAQLPGKKMRSLSALSGGERVLVALSLIFAMLRVHPSPFCIFDEVEAALDDANTKKFTTLLRELAERTQVLIITHNKGTMEAADVLYGVTMEEPGISKIISMRLTRKGVPEPVPVA